MTQLTDYLNRLERLDLIARQKMEPELEYAFRHVFTQESVYDSLLLSDRRQLHQNIGEVLEAALAGELDEGEGPLLLAYHFEQSGDKVRALKYLRQAAANAAQRYANQEARSLYSRALALLGRLEEAREEVRRVLALEPEHADARRALAMIDAALPAKPAKRWWQFWK